MLLAGGCRAEWSAVERAAAELGLAGCVAYAPDMNDALAYLRDSRNAAPCVVLLRVHTASDDGLDVLRTLKADARLHSVPVVVLATSHDRRLVRESFTLGAAGYLAEPTGCRAFAEAIRRIYNYWSLSELPQPR